MRQKLINKELSPELKQKVDDFLDEIFFDVQGVGHKGALSEEYIIKVITKFLVSICTSYWTLMELISYVQTRNKIKEFTTDPSKL